MICNRNSFLLGATAFLLAVLPAVNVLAQHDHQHPGAAAGRAEQKAAPAQPAGQDHSQMEHGAAGANPAAHAAHGGGYLEHSDYKDPKDARPWYLRGTWVGVFNHQMAGVFVMLVGIFVLAQGKLGERWPRIKYVWPLLLLVPGLYLMFFSDTEWPFGGANLFTILANDMEVRQHKTFSMILLILGTIEYLRAKGTLTARWGAFVFPALALGGSILLLFHPHGSHEHTPEAMALMERIQAQHWDFTVVGILIAVTKLVWDVGWVRVKYFAYAWPSLMVVLGALLIRYNE